MNFFCEAVLMLFAGCNRCFLTHVSSPAGQRWDYYDLIILSVVFLAVLHRTGHIMTSGLS